MSFLEDNLDLFLTELKEKDDNLLSKLKRKKITKERLIKFNCDCALIVLDIACKAIALKRGDVRIIRKSLADPFEASVSILVLNDAMEQAWLRLKELRMTKWNGVLGRREYDELEKKFDREFKAIGIVISCIQSIDIDEPWNDLMFKDVFKFNKESKEKALTLLKDLINE